MSSCGNPAAETDALMPRKRKFDRSRVCVKCKTSPGGLVIRHAVYCKACFVPLTTFKFRRALEPSVNAVPDGPRKKALRPTGGLLLAYSGGLGSTVLLDLARKCYFAPATSAPADEQADGGRDHPRNAHERVWPRAAVGFVDVSAAFPGMRDRTDAVRVHVEAHPEFEFVPLRIEDAFDPAWWARTAADSLTSSICVDLANEELPLSAAAAPSSSDSVAPTPIVRLHRYLAALPTQTAVASTVQTLIRVLLLHTARAQGASHLLLGTSLTSLSIALITAMALGGGAAVREEAQEEWATTLPGSRRAWRVRVVRPLRDIGTKECAAWAWWEGLDVVGKDRWPSARQAIGGLTKDFIVGLEKDYPSTVSTIAKTCAKLAPKDDAIAQCISCYRPTPGTAQAWKARISLRTRAVLNPLASGPIDEVVPSVTPICPADAPPSLAPHLCYACHSTLTSRSSRNAPKLGYTNTGAAGGPVHVPVWTAARLLNGGEGGNGEDIAGFGAQIETDGAAGERWATRRMGEGEMRSLVQDFLIEG